MLKKVRTAKKIGYFRREKQQLVDLLLSVINVNVQTVDIVIVEGFAEGEMSSLRKARHHYLDFIDLSCCFLPFLYSFTSFFVVHSWFGKAGQHVCFFSV